jgi:hypothetical protein
MLLSNHENAGKDHDINVEHFKYLGTKVPCQNFIQEEIKRRMVSGISVQNILSSRLLSKNLKIIMYETVVVPMVLYAYETCPRALREEHRLRFFENRVLRIFGPKRDGVTGD